MLRFPVTRPFQADLACFTTRFSRLSQARSFWPLILLARILLRGELDRHVLDGTDEAGAEAVNPGGGGGVGQAGEQGLEHHPQLQTSERSAEAEVLADAEGDMLVRRAAHVEPVGVRKDLLVAVR